MLRRTILVGLSCLGVGGLAQQAPERPGTISGTVIDDTGSHSVGAEVRVERSDDGPRGGMLKRAETDKDGRFIIRGLALGAYRVHASKEQDGYLDTVAWDPFYFDGAITTTTLTERDPGAEVLVLMGPKAATISVSVSDALSGAPLAGGILIYRRIEGLSIEESSTLSSAQPAKYKMMIPSRQPLGIVISSGGYEIWRYPEPLYLQPGSTVAVDAKLVKLRPAPK